MFVLTELGMRLKEARESKGFSLDDLQAVTKIQKRYLVGIEEGNYDMMPGKFYVRAFIKQYAEAVGLEPDALFEEYENDIPSVQSSELPGHISRVQTRKAVSSGTSSKFLDFIPKILAAVFAVGVVALIWFVVQHYVSTDNENAGSKSDKTVVSKLNDDVKKEDNSKNDKKDSGNKNASSSEDEKKDTSSTDKEDQQKPDENQQKISVVNASGSNTTYKVENAEQFKLKVAATANGKTWLRVKNASGATLFQGQLSNAQSKELDLSKEQTVIIRVGDSTGTEIYVNDEKVEFAVPPTEQVTQNITIQHTAPGQ
ncbi:helix-turn-helix domain-containing protein [Falsibacillus pallidus]|uniref:helix-turn-helix domain-containing protein n=1 Tax=Falsibacillus pallidus TaxID=493781 RepID=UPI003D95BA46